MTRERALGLAAAAVLLISATMWPEVSFSAQSAAPETASDGGSSKSWIGREAEFEQFLKAAEPIGIEPIGTGVTKPFRAMLEPGGPVSAFAWKPIRPGFYGGFYESYKSEVAAYELDRVLELGMVPVTVERRVDKTLGAASMWVSPAKTFGELGGVPKPPADQQVRWNIQLVRAKMFDNLIANKDPNLGNWLVDPAWNVLLIDHSRCFATSGKKMAHKLERIDADLWERMLTLEEASLTERLGRWLTRKEIRGILKRRDRMRQLVDALVAERGETAVFRRYREPIH